MKKVLVLLALTVALILCFAACGGQSNNTPEHIHTFGEWENAKNPTCTEAGAAERYCSCGEKQEKELPALGHTIEIIPAVESTCTESGYTEGKKCSTCGEWMVKPEPTHMKAHESETIPEVAPTCAEAGFTESTKCSVCKKVITEPKPVPALGHDLRTVSAKDAECKVYNETICNRGGCDHYDKVYTGNVDHKFGEWKLVTNYTGSPCGVDKVYERKCADCGAVDTKTDPATGHNYKKTIISEHIYDLNNKVATIGETFYKCQNNGCDSEYREYEHHIYTNKTIAPTCTEQGYTSYTCTCGHSYQDNFVPATGHKYGAVATCTTAQTCTVCSIILYPALGHDWKEATCTEPQTCQRPGCGTTGEPALGHTYSKEWQNDDTYHYHLAICGCRDNNNQPLKSDVTVHTFDSNKRCIVCKFEEQIKLSTPIITNIEYDKVYWKAVDNATKYRITVNSDYTYETASLSAAINNVKYNGQSITEAGYITIEICAIGSGRYTTSDNSPQYSSYYVPESQETSKYEHLYSKQIGKGYNLIENEYLNAAEHASQNSLLNIKKLMTIGKYVVPTTNTAGNAVSYNYSSIDEIMAKSLFSMGFETAGGYAPVANVKYTLSGEKASTYKSYKYVETFVLYGAVNAENMGFEYIDPDILKYCLDENFERKVRSYLNSGNTNYNELFNYIYTEYGTHAMTGLVVGGRYTITYTVMTNSAEVAESVKLAFSASLSFGSYMEALGANFKFDVSGASEYISKDSETKAVLSVEYHGGQGGLLASTNSAAANSALSSWSNTVNSTNGVAVGFTDKGAVAISSLLNYISAGLGNKYEEYIDTKADALYHELYDKYTITPTLDVTVSDDNILRIDLTDFKGDGSIDDVYHTNMFKGVFNVYPKMFGKRIDKIVIDGCFDEFNENLLDKFSIKLSEDWNRDVEIEVNNVGVIAASNNGFIDVSSYPAHLDVNINYTGINAIKESTGRIQFHSSIDGKKYAFSLQLNSNEKIDFTNIQIGSTLQLPIVTKVGYTFIRWKDGNGKFVTDKDGYCLSSYTPSTSIVTLYADMVLSSHRVTLDYQGATTDPEMKQFFIIVNQGAYSDFAGVTSIMDQKLNVIPKKTGYEFGGYYLAVSNNSTANAIGTDMYIDANGYVTSYAIANAIEGNITVVAMWKPVAYVITLDNQEATTNGTLTYYTQYKIGVYSNKACTDSIAKISNVPAKDGYIFAGYFTEKNGNGKQIITTDGTINKTESMKFTENVTLYAFWVKVSTITLNKNGAQFAGTTSFIIKYQEGAFVDLACTQSISKITIPKKDGYTFEGYYLGDTQYIDKDGNILDKCKGLNGNSTLTAKWSGITYTVRFYGVFGDLIKVETCEYGKNYQAPRCNIDGYDVYAFSSSVGYVDAGYSYSNLTTVDGKIIEFTAVYERWHYTIHFDIGFFSMNLNDYNDFSGEMSDMTCYWGQSYTLPKYQVTRKGYRFLYWRGNDGVIYYEGSRIENLAKNDGITLTAVWEKL